jgi:hypothetical protein
MSSGRDGPISANPAKFDPMAGTEGVDQVDVLLVGAGFASYTLLNRYSQFTSSLS